MQPGEAPIPHRGRQKNASPEEEKLLLSRDLYERVMKSPWLVDTDDGVPLDMGARVCRRIHEMGVREIRTLLDTKGALEWLIGKLLPEIEASDDYKEHVREQNKCRRSRVKREDAERATREAMNDQWEAMNDRKSRAASRNRLRALADELRSDIYHSPTVEEVEQKIAARVRAAT